MSQMTMTTNHGPIVFEMFDEDAPKTVDNFRKLTADACPWLDGKHTVFGQVTGGADVVETIGAVQTDGRDAPIEPVGLLAVEVA